MKRHVEGLVRQALSAAIEAGELRVPEAPAFAVEVPSDPRFGDLSTNAALVLARAEGRPPHAIARLLVGRLEAAAPAGWLQGPPEIAGPGFINFRLAPAFWQRMLADALASGEAYGRSATGAGRRAQVEFVSANPTGPLTVGHGRNAVIGDALARLLAANGWQVEREYYFNNAGRQMKVLAESVRARYLELIGRPADFPEDGYQGEYIRDIARGLVERHGAALATDDGTAFRAAAEQSIFAAIRATQERLGITFDRYFEEDSLYRSGAIQRTLDALEARGLTERREGAVWLRGAAVGLAQDRVLVKSSGEPAYRLPDIAYHLDKLARGFDAVIDVLGADHIAEHQEVAAALRALGVDAARVRAVIYQFVTLTRHGEQVKMSWTRRASSFSCASPTAISSSTWTSPSSRAPTTRSSTCSTRTRASRACCARRRRPASRWYPRRISRRWASPRWRWCARWRAGPTWSRPRRAISSRTASSSTPSTWPAPSTATIIGSAS